MPDREKVIRGLEHCSDRRKDGIEHCAGCSYGEWPISCRGEVMEDALALLKAQESGWISVKDRLPEVGGWYLCFKESAFVPGLRIDVHRWSETREEWSGSEVGSRIVGVTHWMPLPEPPKEGT